MTGESADRGVPFSSSLELETITSSILWATLLEGIKHSEHRKEIGIMGIETPAFVIGALTAGGGTFGYIKTGSVPSIAAGLTVGALYLLGGYRIQSKQSYGVELALLASIVLAGSSIPRALKSQKPLPIGLSLLALYGLYTYGNAYRQKL
ncbi:TMEM14-domain-containing protein [Hyaloscypha variabilis F]|uniref:TMEM14-domain-containing protein n=1 Tax=Hyaloscypha variabilis (strain UAMH 11265 / GT02V1 / F) TaxID=1149755 RepID=A0A2J6QY17_HYAVF|nr:TMEM14-domain-containing protein [Hyaloscypha variabilis F]